jgi:predicted nucleic-acid-binding protein
LQGDVRQVKGVTDALGQRHLPLRGHPPRARGAPALTAFLDTNVLIRQLTGDPPDLARRATALLGSGERLLLADLVLAECVYVLESFYELERERVATLMRAAIGHGSMETVDPSTLLRALEVYELVRIDFAEAYLVAQAEATGVGEIVSFNRAIDHVSPVTRREP